MITVRVAVALTVGGDVMDGDFADGRERGRIAEQQMRRTFVYLDFAGRWPCICEMAKNLTLRECFEHFGAVTSHRHFSLSAVSNDGRTVVVGMWDDEFESQEGRTIYQSRYRTKLKGNPMRANKQWIANLKWARRHCDSEVRVVVLRAEDVEANPRTVMSCYPDDSLLMRITHFDTKTGAFRAEQVKLVGS
jgi:hypothetical protein